MNTHTIERKITLIKSLGFYNKKFKKEKEFTIPLTNGGSILLIRIKPFATSFAIVGIVSIDEILHIDEEVKHGLFGGDREVFSQMEINDEFSFAVNNGKKTKLLIYKKIDIYRARLMEIKKNQRKHQ